MQIEGQTALVTGANRGLGLCFAEELRNRGAKVYAGARNPAAVQLEGVTPIALDITDEVSVQAAAEATGDVSILINNAGVGLGGALVTGSLDEFRQNFDTNLFGTLLVVRAFAPQLAQHSESSILNVLSALSWITFPGRGGYCGSKAAEWSLTNTLRQELAADGTVVSALHVGYMDTDMVASVTAPKADPRDVARIGVDGIAFREFEILADEVSRRVLGGLSGGVAALYPQLT